MVQHPIPVPVTAPDGTRLAAWDWPGRADRTPYLLVHGLASNARTWDQVARRLNDLGHPVFWYDQRGHGRSDRPTDGYDMPTAVADLAAVVDAAAFRTPPIVAGQSWGGNLVVAYAAQVSRALAGIVPVDGGTIDLQRQFPSWEACAAALAPPRLELDLGARRAALRASRPTWPEEGIAATLANLEAGPDGSARNRLPPAAHMSLLRAMWEHPPRGHYGALTCPALFLMARTGDHEWTAAKQTAAEEAATLVPAATVVWVGGDHDLHVEQPDVVAGHLLDPRWRA